MVTVARGAARRLLPAPPGPEAGPGGRLGAEDAQVLEQDGQAERDEGETP